MRRLMTTLALTGAVALALAGCAAPGGADGDLTNDWAALGEPKVFTPAAGTCHGADFSEVSYLSSYLPIDCAGSHQVETVHVGTFTGAAATGQAPPARESAERRAAYAECDTRARGYLGADWRVARLWLGVSIPSERAWNGGARWFRCDVVEVVEVEEEGLTTSRTGSLKDALKTAGKLHLGCYATTLDRNDAIDRMSPTACDARHNTEFAGVWRAPSGQRYPQAERDWGAFYGGCYGVIARFAAVSRSSVEFRTGVIALPSGEDDWATGDRGVRCYLWKSDARFTRSMKDAGPRGLPVETG